MTCDVCGKRILRTDETPEGAFKAVTLHSANEDLTYCTLCYIQLLQMVLEQQIAERKADAPLNGNYN